MPSNPQVLGLLEEMLDSGKTPEEVCRECPDLLAEVRQRWKEFQFIDGQIKTLLPGLGTRPTAAATAPPATGLPPVPGYEVEAVLGHGGMGIVYKARHLALKRTVALKMLAAGHPYSAERARFRAEAEAVARLQHPNIVQVFEVGETDGRPFLALEYVAGGSLAERLAGQPLLPREAARLVAAMAEAMHLAHSRNLVHRDLKPGNVLLAGEADTPLGQCQPKVTDFGLVRQLDADSGQTFDGMVMGTPSYMAPEQAEGRARSAGPAADVYALGAILYECLTGRPPFQGATPLAILEQVRNREPQTPSSLNSQVPRDLETICLKCLRKEPERRYSSARELADDLGRFVRGEPVAARPVGVAERVRKWVWRRPAAAGLLTAVLLLVAFGGSGAWLLHQQRAAARDRQAQTDQEVRRDLERARGLLEEGWTAQDLAKLTAAQAEGHRVVDIARSGAASTAVRRQAEAFRADADERLGRARKNATLREAVLDVAAPQETRSSAPGEATRLASPAQPSVDEQYAAAFRRWGLDVDRTAEADVVARLGAEPDAVVAEVIAALDGWMLERRRQKRPEAEWRRLFRVARQLDRSERRRWLRALLVGESPPRAASVASLVGTRSFWPALWQVARGDDWQRLREVHREIDPRTAPVLTVVLLAQAYTVVGDADAAEQVLSEAATARPDQVVLLDALAKLLERQEPSRRSKAIEYYRAVRGQRRGLGIAMSGALISDRRPKEAEDVLRDLLHQQGETPRLYNCLGVCLDAQKKHEAAEAAYRKAIALAPDSADAHCNLGMCLADQKRYAAAKQTCRKAVDLRPDWADAWYYLGYVLDQQKNRTAAAEAYRKAIARRPDWADAHYNLGYALFHQGEPGAAEAAFRKAIDLRPGFALAHNNLGMALAEQRKLNEAETAFRKAINLQPGSAQSYNNLGMALAQQRKLSEAEAAFRKAIDLRPGFALAHFNLAFALMEQARFDEALGFVNKGNALLPAKDPLREQARPMLVGCQRYVALDARLPAILQGTAKPRSAAEQIEFAQLCRLKKLYASAALFYAAAFAAESKLAQDVPAGARYNAACVAALAGCGQGKDVDRVDDKEFARLRRQARDWLREDLAWWGKALARGNTQTGAVVRLRMQYWQADHDLAGLREPGALEALSPDERKECLALWQEVAALLRRVQTLE
jgi:serine/threonine-protein kinase